VLAVFHRGTRHAQAGAATAPLAICRAALAAGARCPRVIGPARPSAMRPQDARRRQGLDPGPEGAPQRSGR
jgi:hypothetical protein